MDETIYLTLEDILSYYRETIEQSGGGMSVIREKESIEKILDFVQNDLYYSTLEEKLTYLVYSFCTGHYFFDGNKRISLVIGAHFLIKNKHGWAGFHSSHSWKRIYGMSQQAILEKNCLGESFILS